MSRLLYKLGWFSLLQFVVKRRLYDKEFIIPQRGMVGYKNLFEWEGWMTQVFNEIKIEEGLFLDIGCNIGQTLLKVKAIDSDISYVGLEPNPVCLEYLGHLISTNNFRNTEILPYALYNDNGKATLSLYRDDPTDGRASLVPSFRPYNKILSHVEVKTIDGMSLIQKINEKVQTIKIDVEGAEKEVLVNLEVLIQRDRPFILIEILPVYDKKNIARLKSQEAIEELIKKWTYGIYLVKFNGSYLEGLEERLEFGIHSDINQVDYLLVPEERRMN